MLGCNTAIAAALFGGGGSDSTAPVLLEPVVGQTDEIGTVVALTPPDSYAATATAVTYYDGETEIGSPVAAPWSYEWTPAAGEHSVHAVITTATGEVTTASTAITTLPAIAEDPSDVASLAVWYSVADLTPVDGHYESWPPAAGTGPTLAEAADWPTVGKIRNVTAPFFGTSGVYEKMVGYLTVAQPYTLSFVARAEYLAGGNERLICSADLEGVRPTSGSAAWPRELSFDSGATVAASVLPDQGAHQIEFHAAGAASWRGMDGVGATISAGTDAFADSLVLGNDLRGGAIGDFVFLSSASAADRGAVARYLDRTYHLSEPSLRVCWMGDSITAGTGSVLGGGWRRVAWGTITARKVGGRWLEPSGNVAGWAAGELGMYGATPGWQIADVSATVAANIGSEGTRHQVDIGVLLIGYNDAAQAGYVGGTGPGTTIQAWIDLVRLLLTNGVRALVLSPVLYSQNEGANLVELRGNQIAAIAALIAEGLPVVYHPGHLAVGTYDAEFYSDSVHLLDAGYERFVTRAVNGQNLLTALARAAQLCADPVLTVNGGVGSGALRAGTTRRIHATPAAGYGFVTWTGATGLLSSATDPHAVLTMGTSAATVSATTVALPAVAITSPEASWTWTEGTGYAVTGTCTGATTVDVLLGGNDRADAVIDGATWSATVTPLVADIGVGVDLVARATNAGGSTDSASVSGTVEASSVPLDDLLALDPEVCWMAGELGTDYTVGDPASELTDASTNGNDITESVAGDRPDVVVSGTDTYCYFDWDQSGGDAAGCQMHIPPGVISAATALTVSMLVRLPITGTIQQLLGCDASDLLIQRYATGNPIRCTVGGVANYGWFALADTADVHHIVFRYDGSQADNATRLRGTLDGVAKSLTFGGTIPPTAIPTVTAIAIGRSVANGSPAEMHLYALTIVRAALSDEQIATIDAVYSTNCALYRT